MSGEVFQPRYAAWLESLGLPATEGGRDQAIAMHGGNNRAANITFMDFISRAKASAPADVLRGDHISDHNSFTRHCRGLALTDCLARFPS